MHSGSDFNIITGEVLGYQNERRFRSMDQLMKMDKSVDQKLARVKLPSLGSPKDKHKFQYSYIDLPNPQPPHQPPSNPTPTPKTILNYTYLHHDPITHRNLSPTSIQLTHKIFSNPLPCANAKGILTAHIDKARAFAPNFHEDFQERVQKREFYRRREICGDTVRNQKGYGVSRFFRKFKVRSLEERGILIEVKKYNHIPPNMQQLQPTLQPSSTNSHHHSQPNCQTPSHPQPHPQHPQQPQQPQHPQQQQTQSQQIPSLQPIKLQYKTHRKNQAVLTRYEKGRLLMLKKAEGIVKEIGDEELCGGGGVGVQGVSEVRMKNRRLIYKYLILGYQQIQKQSQITKTLTQSPTHPFLTTYPTLLQSLPHLLQTSIQLQQKLFTYHPNPSSYSYSHSSLNPYPYPYPYPNPPSLNNPNTPTKQSKKYQIQMKHLLDNLGDLENCQFREDVVVGRYDAEDVAGMSFIDMMEKRKKLYVYTRSQYLLDYSLVNMERNRRQEAYEHEIMRKARNSRRCLIQDANKNIERQSIEYFLSNKFIEKLEVELMEIPMKIIRKAALANLKRVFE